MGDSRGNDYFSFMSDKSDSKRGLPDPGRSSPAPAPASRADVVEFVEDSPIEVIESTASDTMIERVFKMRRRAG